LVPQSQTGISLRSPDSSGSLAAAIFTDTEGLSFPVSVGQALSVPPVSRAVDLYTAATSQLTLTASAPSPSTTWLDWTEGSLSPAFRNVSMVLDLFWHRMTCLAVTRDADGMVSNGVHIPWHMWDFDQNGMIRYDGRAVPQEQVLFIPGFKQLGFLEYAQESIRQYLSMCRTITDRAENPKPMLGLKIKEDFIPDADEADTAHAEWTAMRKAPGGGTAFIPAGIDVQEYGGEDASAWLIEARNAIRLDVGNFTNLPASLVEGNSGASGDYSNTLQVQNEFIRLSLALFTRPIEARLSQDDVTPEGVTVTFNSATLDTLTEPAKGNLGSATASPAPIGDTPA
jgi:hypothetical protein